MSGPGTPPFGMVALARASTEILFYRGQQRVTYTRGKPSGATTALATVKLAMGPMAAETLPEIAASSTTSERNLIIAVRYCEI